MKWAIVYSDKTRYDGFGAPNPSIRRYGVQVVGQEDDRVGYEIVRSSDGIWIWKDDRWFGSDQFGFWDYLFHHDGSLIVLFGRWCLDSEWDKMFSEELKIKSAWKKYE